MKELNQENYKQLGAWQAIFEIPITFVKVGQIKSIVFEIKTKENGHNEPHCHVKYQEQEISISLLEGHRILERVSKLYIIEINKLLKIVEKIYEMNYQLCLN